MSSPKYNTSKIQSLPMMSAAKIGGMTNRQNLLQYRKLARLPCIDVLPPENQSATGCVIRPESKAVAIIIAAKTSAENGLPA